MKIRWTLEVDRTETPEHEKSETFAAIVTIDDDPAIAPYVAEMLSQQIAETLLVRVFGHDESKTEVRVRVT